MNHQTCDLLIQRLFQVLFFSGLLRWLSFRIIRSFSFLRTNNFGLSFRSGKTCTCVLYDPHLFHSAHPSLTPLCNLGNVLKLFRCLWNLSKLKIWHSERCLYCYWIRTLADSGFLKNSLYQGGVKSTVTWVFEDLKFKFSESYDPNWCFPDSAQLAVSANLRTLPS